MSVIYHAEDGNLNTLAHKNIGVIGYGNMGRPIALNLRDLNLNLVVGSRSEESQRRALADGITVAPVENIVRDAHIIWVLVSDDVIASVYLEKISPYLSRGQSLIFTSGYSITFGFIEPPPFVDVGLIAPRAFGEIVREKFLSREGFYSFVAVGQDATGKIWDIVLALAKAIGSLEKGAIEITLEQEAELDLFVQQTVLPAIYRIMLTAASLLLEVGYPPEATMMDLYLSGEFSEIIRRAAEIGLLQSIKLSSLTGQYGMFSRLQHFSEPKFEQAMEKIMEKTLNEIRNGSFAREWAKEYASGYPKLRKFTEQQESLDLWNLEQQTIELLKETANDYISNTRE